MACSSLFLLLLLPLLFSRSSAHSITLPLSSSKTKYQRPSTTHSLGRQLSYMATSKAISTATARLFGIWGAYQFNLKLGTPPQELTFALVTSGGLTSFPCGNNFSCINCTIDPKKIQTFKPHLSNTSEPVYCNNTVLNKILGRDLISSCAHCGSNASCSAAPAEFYEYGAEGKFISESLTLPGTNEQADDLIVGCASQLNTFPGIGLSEFGPVPLSLPAQLKVKEFSHCLAHKKYRHTNVSGSLVLSWKTSNDDENVKYTPFQKIQNATWQEEIYYVNLEKLLVGDVELELPADYLATNLLGNGGVAIEAGSAVSIMENRVFEPLLKEFDNQVGKNHVRATDVETESTYRPCYILPNSTAMNNLPVLRFGFKGGAEIVVPGDHYMWHWNESVACMAVWADVNATEPLVGPAIILGQWLMQNLKVTYDLVGNRIGFKSQNCAKT